MDETTRNTYLGTAMFLEHTEVLQPSVIEVANLVARQDGFEIPLAIEESLSQEDKRDIVTVAAETVYLGRRGKPTELEQLIMLRFVDGSVSRSFLSAQDAFEVMSRLMGSTPRNSSEYTPENWKSALDSMVRFPWQTIELQLQELREKAGHVVTRANDEIQHQLAGERDYWEQILQRHLDYAEAAAKPTFNDALIIFNATADVAWQYKIEIAKARPLF